MENSFQTINSTKKVILILVLLQRGESGISDHASPPDLTDSSSAFPNLNLLHKTLKIIILLKIIPKMYMNL